MSPHDVLPMLLEWMSSCPIPKPEVLRIWKEWLEDPALWSADDSANDDLVSI